MALQSLPPKEYLDSDRLNYLVWRYLLEGDYRETAAKFQKEWRVLAPHRQFAFAPHVQNQALVEVVQRGLLYYACQRQIEALKSSKTDAEEGATSASQVGIFGPLGDRTGLRREDEQEDADGEPDEGDAGLDQAGGSRKRPVDRRGSQLLNGLPAAKRPRFGNGDENAADAATTRASAGPSPALDGVAAVVSVAATEPSAATTPPAATAAATTAAAAATAATASDGDGGATAMDIDDQPPHQHQHAPPAGSRDDHQLHTQTDSANAYPSPMDSQQALLSISIPHLQGLDKGTQLGKVEDLATATTFLQLTGGNGSFETASSPIRAGGGDHAPVLLHCEWNPRDSTTLAAAGTDALAGIWTVTGTATTTTPGPSPVHGHVNGDGPTPPASASASASSRAVVQPTFLNVMPDSAPAQSLVTAIAWNGDGSTIAVATEHGNNASVTIWSSLGECLQQLAVNEPPVVKLRWNPNNVGLLAIAPDSNGTAITIFTGEGRLNYALPAYDILRSSRPLDVTWTSDSDFLLCGEDLLMALRCTASGVELLRKFELESGDGFVQVLFDPYSRLAATPTSGGNVVIWNDAGERRAVAAHAGMITAAQWQPGPGNATDDQRLMATGGDDCTILVWNARKLDYPIVGRLVMGAPVLALAFTPDGAFLAGATASEVLIWKVGEYFLPRASWTRTPHPGWLSPKSNENSEEVEDVYCLCWNAEGQKLAYGANSRLAIIGFR